MYNKTELKKEMLDTLGVTKFENFDVKTAIRKRITYLKKYLIESGMNGFVLGISGGVDSTTTGRLCKLAVDELNQERGSSCKFISIRLPAGIQKDHEFAGMALDFINPSRYEGINIGPAASDLSDKIIDSYYFDHNYNTTKPSDEVVDFHKGNLKARLRMAVQYYFAALHNCLVIGTDHNAEAAAGFYTKHGDGACDLIVLNGLNKRQVRAMAKELGAPEALYNKPATADLEELDALKLDEAALGFSYDAMDDFLEGKQIDVTAEDKILDQYYKTQHKRNQIVAFPCQ